MTNAGQWATIIYAILMLGGGISGYATKHSMPSLIAGIVSAILLGTAYLLERTFPRVGFAMSLVVAAGLAVVFLMRVMKTGKMMPSGGLCALSVIMAIFFAIAIWKEKS